MSSTAVLPQPLTAHLGEEEGRSAAAPPAPPEPRTGRQEESPGSRTSPSWASTGSPVAPANDLEVVATARLRGLDAQARAEVREAAQRIISYGLGCLTSELLLTELNAVPASPGSFAPGGNVWRNVHYGDPDSRRLPVFSELGVQKDPLGSLPFGERLVVADEADLGTQLWVRLADGPFTGKWVLARSEGIHGSVVNCVRMSEWARKRGAIPHSAFKGQGFPEAGMCTKGYAGSGEVCLVSAANGSLWRALHVETLFRDIATATVREDDWAGETHFGERIVHFATNCAQYGQLRTRRPKRLIVIVRHTPRWRLYQHGLCAGPKLSSVKEDVDAMQFKECTWLHSGAQGLELKWSTVEFVTAFEFLRTFCNWADTDCRRAANEKLVTLLENFHTYSVAECRSHLEAVYWCWDEAFQGVDLEADDAAARESVCQLLRELASAPDMRPGLELGALKASSEHVKDSSSWAATLGTRVWRMLLAPTRAATESVGQQVYVVGGCSSSCLSSADRLTPCKSLWSGSPSAPSKRSHLAAAVVRGGLFVLGGRDGSGGFLASVERFDADRRSWSAVAPLATARAGLAAVALGGVLYAVGGWDGRSQLAVAECLDPSAPTAWRPLAPAPTARGGLAAAACLEAGLYVLGGEGSGRAALTAMERFNPAVGSWSEAPPMPTARSGLAATVFGAGLFAVGGFEGDTALGTVERFDLGEGTWSSTTPGLPTPRHGLAAVALAGALYALGGRDAKYSALAIVERFDPVEGRWTSAAPMPTARGYLAAGVLSDCLWQGNPCGNCHPQ